MNIYPRIAFAFLILTIALLVLKIPSTWPYITAGLAILFGLVSIAKSKRRGK